MIHVPRHLDATIVLVRHGESVFITEGRFQGQADSALSPTGLRQADLVAARLAAPHRSPALPIPLGPPVELVHSPLRRTTQTAHAIRDAIEAASGDHLRVRASADVLEIAQGDWEGMPRQEVFERYPDELAGWRETPLTVQAPGGERVLAVESRVRDLLDGIVAALVAAAPPPEGISLGASPVAGYPGDHPREAPWTIVVGHDGVFKVVLMTLLGIPLERFWSFPFALCCITAIELRDGKPILRLHNSTEHLAPLLDERAQAETETRQRTGAL